MDTNCPEGMLLRFFLQDELVGCYQTGCKKPVHAMVDLYLEHSASYFTRRRTAPNHGPSSLSS